MCNETYNTIRILYDVVHNINLNHNNEIKQLESEITDLENTETEHEDMRYDLDWHIEKQTNMEFIQIYYVVNASKIISKIIQLVYGVLIAMNIAE